MLYSDLGNNPKELKSKDKILDRDLSKRKLCFYIKVAWLMI